MLRTIACATLLGLIARAAGAEPPGDPTGEARTIALEGTLGLGAPLGLAGLVVAYRPMSKVSVDAGAGVGRAGPQAALTARVWPWQGGPVAFGAGVSAGDYRVGHAICLPDTSCNYRDVVTVWANGDVSYAWAIGARTTLRLFVGAGLVVNRAAFRDEAGTMSPNMADGLWLPFAGIALARWW